MTKICPQCDAIVPLGTIYCECGYVWTKQRHEEIIEQVTLELEPLNGFAIQEYAVGKSLEELKAIQEIKNYKKYWVYHQLQSLEDLKMFGEWMNHYDGWFDDKKHSFNPQTIEEKRAAYNEYLNKRNNAY